MGHETKRKKSYGYAKNVNAITPKQGCYELVVSRISKQFIKNFMNMET